MKLKFDVILASELEIGDIFYCTPNEEMNEFGEDYSLTGTDQIFIMDDSYEEDEDGNHAILINGGWHIWFRPDEKVVRLGRYRKLMRVIEMVKEGNPSMVLGPNDMPTRIERLIAENPHIEFRSPLDDLDIDFNRKFDEEEDTNDDTDNELPF